MPRAIESARSSAEAVSESQKWPGSSADLPERERRNSQASAGRRPSGGEVSPFLPIHVLTGHAAGAEIHLSDGCEGVAVGTDLDRSGARRADADDLPGLKPAGPVVVQYV